MASRRINNDGLNLIKEFEGFSAKPYLCPAGVPTIGYGHTKGVTMNHPEIKKSVAEDMLRDDLRFAENGVEMMVRVPVGDNQFSALVSLVFNIGHGAFRSSTLLRLLNAAKYDAAAEQFLRWNKAGGKEIAGLTRRRAAEKALFLKS